MQAAKGHPAPGQLLPAKLAAKGTAPGPGAAPASAGRLADSAHASWEPEDLHALVQTVQSLDALPPGQHARSGSSSGGHSMCSGSERTSGVAPRAGAPPLMHACKADQAQHCSTCLPRCRQGIHEACLAEVLSGRLDTAAQSTKLAGVSPRQAHAAASMERCWCALPNFTALFPKQCPSIQLGMFQMQQRCMQGQAPQSHSSLNRRRCICCTAGTQTNPPGAGKLCCGTGTGAAQVAATGRPRQRPGQPCQTKRTGLGPMA